MQERQGSPRIVSGGYFRSIIMPGIEGSPHSLLAGTSFERSAPTRDDATLLRVSLVLGQTSRRPGHTLDPPSTRTFSWLTQASASTHVSINHAYELRLPMVLYPRSCRRRVPILLFPHRTASPPSLFFSLASLNFYNSKFNAVFPDFQYDEPLINETDRYLE